MNKIILFDAFEQVLLANWSSFLDKTQLLKIVLEHARNNEYSTSLQDKIPPRHTKVTLTKFTPKNKKFLIWVEFTIPKEEGVVVGSHVYDLMFDGELVLTESYGKYFCLNNIKPLHDSSIPI